MWYQGPLSPQPSSQPPLLLGEAEQLPEHLLDLQHLYAKPEHRLESVTVVPLLSNMLAISFYRGWRHTKLAPLVVLWGHSHWELGEGLWHDLRDNGVGRYHRYGGLWPLLHDPELHLESGGLQPDVWGHEARHHGCSVHDGVAVQLQELLCEPEPRPDCCYHLATWFKDRCGFRHVYFRNRILVKTWQLSFVLKL